MKTSAKKDREQTAARYSARFPGWRLHRLGTSGGLGSCPRPLVRKQCRVFTGRGPMPRRDCVCQLEGVAHCVLDHARYWKTPDGELVLTAEPYRGSLDSERGRRALDAFTAGCSELGLQVERSDDSPWNPGSTVLLIVRRAS